MVATHVPTVSPLQSHQQRSVTFDLPLTRADMGDFLGLTIETVSRQFSRLRQDGIINVENNRHITIPDMQCLFEMAEG